MKSWIHAALLLGAAAYFTGCSVDDTSPSLTLNDVHSEGTGDVVEGDTAPSDDTTTAEDVDDASEPDGATDGVNDASPADDVEPGDITAHEDVDFPFDGVEFDVGPDDIGAPDVAASDAEPTDVGPIEDTPAVDIGTLEDAPPPIDGGGIDVPDTVVDFDIGADVDLADVAGDVGFPDVPPGDLGGDDAGPADTGPGDAGTFDIGPPPVEGRLYRLTTLTWVAPPLCFPGAGDGCVDITSYANTLVDDIWNDPDEPTDVGLRMASTDAAGAVDAELGGLDCLRDEAVILSCELIDPPPPASFELQWTAAPGTCGTVNAPCFQTEADVPSLAIQLGTYQIGLSNGSLAGRLQGETPDQAVVDGGISGFLPEKIAKTLVFNTGNGNITLAQLLAKWPKTTVNGQAGWEVDLGFEAGEVPESPL